jgi:hypothetical protein
LREARDAADDQHGESEGGAEPQPGDEVVPPGFAEVRTEGKGLESCSAGHFLELYSPLPWRTGL